MDGRLKAMNEYYTNLEYGNLYDKEKALMEIRSLSQELKFTDVNDFSERFLKTASIIKKNLFIFTSACEHTDIITTTVEYLNYFGLVGMTLMVDKYDKEYQKDDVILLVILTILKICNIFEMQLFLQNAIIKNSLLEKSILYNHEIYGVNFISIINDTHEMILLEDSDLYAVISLLKHRKSLLLSLNIIWIQEPIKEKFLWLVKEYFENFDFPIYTFRTKKELFTASTPNKMNIVSIWTEDVIFAKNLAMSLNKDVLFINTYMDFYGGIVLLPYTKIFEKGLSKWCKSNFDDCTEKLSMQKSIVYDLFYDGMWQRPIKGTYWIHNDSQWAKATSDDINKCISSAEKGFKIWSAKSITCRMQVLSDFASMVKCNGKPVLAETISQWIKFSLYENSLFCSRSGGLEVTKIRNPRGVIILKEKDETILFRRLIQSLTVGNSVIVLCDKNSCSLAPYCNMFLASKISPGVINLLSNENIKELELGLCRTDYASYAEQLFSGSNVEEIYINLTIPKQIIVPLK